MSTDYLSDERSYCTTVNYMGDRSRPATSPRYRSSSWTCRAICEASGYFSGSWLNLGESGTSVSAVSSSPSNAH
eukprot:symbB.v1.2.008893.t1/scaffold551.1/size272348/3